MSCPDDGDNDINSSTAGTVPDRAQRCYISTYICKHPPPTPTRSGASDYNPSPPCHTVSASWTENRHADSLSDRLEEPVPTRRVCDGQERPRFIAPPDEMYTIGFERERMQFFKWNRPDDFEFPQRHRQNAIV